MLKPRPLGRGYSARLRLLSPCGKGLSALHTCIRVSSRVVKLFGFRQSANWQLTRCLPRPPAGTKQVSPRTVDRQKTSQVTPSRCVRLGHPIGVPGAWHSHRHVGPETRGSQTSALKCGRGKPRRLRRGGCHGYVRAFHTYRGQKEHVAIHRLLAVAEYGLGALDGKVVHHKNHVPWDNRPENIELMRPEEHGRLHAEERWSDSNPNN